MGNTFSVGLRVMAGDEIEFDETDYPVFGGHTGTVVALGKKGKVTVEFDSAGTYEVNQNDLYILDFEIPSDRELDHQTRRLRASLVALGFHPTHIRWAGTAFEIFLSDLCDLQNPDLFELLKQNYIVTKYNKSNELMHIAAEDCVVELLPHHTPLLRDALHTLKHHTSEDQITFDGWGDSIKDSNPELSAKFKAIAAHMNEAVEILKTAFIENPVSFKNLTEDKWEDFDRE